MLFPLSYALVGHLVGDFILQNHWMAVEKKKRSLPCFVHCLIYTISIAIFTGWPMWALLVVFATHFFIDRTQFIHHWMGMMGQSGFRDGMAPWSSVIVDNTWHVLILCILHRMISA